MLGKRQFVISVNKPTQCFNFYYIVMSSAKRNTVSWYSNQLPANSAQKIEDRSAVFLEQNKKMKDVMNDKLSIHHTN